MFTSFKLKMMASSNKMWTTNLSEKVSFDTDDFMKDWPEEMYDLDRSRACMCFVDLLKIRGYCGRSFPI